MGRPAILYGDRKGPESTPLYQPVRFGLFLISGLKDLFNRDSGALFLPYVASWPGDT